jgi:hypothetical protein
MRRPWSHRKVATPIPITSTTTVAPSARSPPRVISSVVAAAGAWPARAGIWRPIVKATASALAAIREKGTCPATMADGASSAPKSAREKKAAAAPMAWPTNVFQGRAASWPGVTVWMKMVGPRLGNSQGCWNAQPSPPMSPVMTRATHPAYRAAPSFNHLAPGASSGIRSASGSRRTHGPRCSRPGRRRDRRSHARTRSP